MITQSKTPGSQQKQGIREEKRRTHGESKLEQSLKYALREYLGLS